MPDLVFPPEQITDWTANVYTGVIGGIPTNYTQSGSAIPPSGSDQSATINSALSSASVGQFVLLAAGVHRTDATVTIPTGRVLRFEDGAILEVHTTIKGVYCGSDSNYDINTSAGDAITAGNTQGSNTITIADTTAYSVDQMILLQADNDLTNPLMPIVSDIGFLRIRTQMARVVSKTGTTITFFPEIHDDWSAVDTYVKPFTAQSRDAGLENATIDCVNTGAIWGVQFEQTMDCWITNCTIKNCSNYNVHLWHCLNTEVFHNVIGPLLHGGSNGAGLLHEASCQSLVIDNIVFDSFPNIELWGGGNQGNAFAYNILDITTGAGFLDHNTSDAFNVLEANVISSVQDDGYFGISLRQTAFRNQFFGIRQGIESGEAVGFAVSVNRFNRYRGFVGNYFAADPSYGNPNIGNSSSSGVVAPSCALATLTTRTSATVGTITGPSGHTVTTGATITIAWAEDAGGGTQIARIRRGVTVGTVSGTAIPFSGGVGDDLPADESTVYIPNTNGSLAEWWAQYDATGSTITGSLTTRTNDGAGTFTITGNGTIVNDNWPTSFRWAAGFRFQMTVGTVAGAAVPLSSINNAGGDVLPAALTAGSLYSGPNGYQELDLDTLVTTWSIGNWWASEAGIPAWESLGGDTLQDSLIFTSAPSWMAGYTYPFNPNDGSPDAAAIPAGDRYLNGVDPQGTIVNVTNLIIG
jgi:hypothetical protein